MDSLQINNWRTNDAYTCTCLFYNSFENLGYVIRQTTPYRIIRCLKNSLARLLHKFLAGNIAKHFNFFPSQSCAGCAFESQMDEHDV